jgi:type IV pilus assembly protein PilA
MTAASALHNDVHRGTTKALMLPVEHPLNKTMTHQTMSNQAKNKSINNLARHQRFGASSLARMRHSKGFTLVELMVVIVIVGILSAVALPKFLGVKDKAKLNTQLGEAAGLAKECSAAIIAEGTYPADYKTDPTTGKTNTDLKITNDCNALGDTANPPTLDITYTTTPATASSGAKCGSTTLANTKKCEVMVVANQTTATTLGVSLGDIAYAQVD